MKLIRFDGRNVLKNIQRGEDVGKEATAMNNKRQNRPSTVSGLDLHLDLDLHFCLHLSTCASPKRNDIFVEFCLRSKSVILSPSSQLAGKRSVRAFKFD